MKQRAVSLRQLRFLSPHTKTVCVRRFANKERLQRYIVVKLTQQIGYVTRITRTYFGQNFDEIHVTAWDKELSCRREAARHYVSSESLLSHSLSLNRSQN